MKASESLAKFFTFQVNAAFCESVYQSVSSLTLNDARNEFRHRGYKTLFMLNSTEHELYTAHKKQLMLKNE